MRKKVAIATHVFSPGTSQALRDYLAPEHDVLFIEHPLFGNIFSWSWGALDTFLKVIRVRGHFDLFVGSNNLNSFVGVLLRKAGKVERVIFYTPDSPPERFRSRVLNRIYRWMDYYCLRHCDLVWNNSPAMAEQREKRGVPARYRARQIDVPMGTDRLTPKPFEEIDRYAIGFVGHLKEGMGLEILIAAFEILSRRLPAARLLIIGSGPIEARLRRRAAKLNVEFTGLIDRLSLVYERLSRCAIAAAPYEENTSSRFTDPGKVKLYLSCSLPVLITRVPRIADEIEARNCGAVVRPDPAELAAAAERLLENEELLRTSRRHARELAEEYSWETIFKRALEGFL